MNLLHIEKICWILSSCLTSSPYLTIKSYLQTLRKYRKITRLKLKIVNSYGKPLSPMILILIGFCLDLNTITFGPKAAIFTKALGS